MNATPAQAAALRLADLAHARSGDKGDHANIGVIAYTPSGYAFLKEHLTPARVHDYFRDLGPEVERFQLPKLHAFNFLLKNVLGGGASESLRTDTQGKVLATALLEMEIPRPDNWQTMIRPEGAP